MNIENINTTCPICMNNIENPCTIGCRHLFCKTCIVTWLSLDDMLNSHKCPVCRRNYIGLFEIEEKLINILRKAYYNDIFKNFKKIYFPFYILFFKCNCG